MSFILVNFPVVSGGFALLAGTGGALTVLGDGGVFLPLVAAGALGVLGED